MKLCLLGTGWNMLVLAAKCTTEAELHDLGWLLEHEGGGSGIQEC